MNAKLNTVLLIDDDDATNFLHQKVIREHHFAKNCHVFEGGEEALSYLTSKNQGEYPRPDLILLDVNMPVMNGWEFLDKYATLEEVQKGKVVLVMLTTSLNPDDEKRGNALPDVASFMRKPLTINILEHIINVHFTSNS